MGILCAARKIVISSWAQFGRRLPAKSARGVILSSARCAGVMIAALALIAEFGMPWISQPISAAAVDTADADNSQIGTITLQTGEDECELMKFNNQTGALFKVTRGAAKTSLWTLMICLCPWARSTASMRSAGPS